MKKIKLMGAVLAAAALSMFASCDLEVKDELNLPHVELGEIMLPVGGYTEIADKDIWTDTKIDSIDFDLDDGLSFSYYIKGGCASDWGMFITTTAGNIGHTCLHYLEDNVWKSNAWFADATNDYGEGAEWDTLKNKCNDTGVYVTISLNPKNDSITWYLDGALYVRYNAAFNAKDATFPSMGDWIDGVLQAIKDTGCTINPTDSWANAGNSYGECKGLVIDKAVDDAGAKNLYDTYGASF